MILDETFTLANGLPIPKLGFGTWFIEDGSAAQAVGEAISIGYRNIDTAQAYGNERGVGEGVRSSGVPREDLFVSSKLAAEIKDYSGAVAAIDGSLETMGLDYLDLMLIHSPQPWNDWRGGSYAEGNREAWRALEEAHDAGKLRSIGVSNFEQADLENILDACTVAPSVNQILLHVGNTPTELLDFCTDTNLLVEAYSPIAHGEILRNEEVAAIAVRYSVSVAQLCIRYAVQLGTVPLPKTTNPDHMRTNADVDFTISAEDMDALYGMRVTDYGKSGKFPVFSGK
ncbi:aldo/keto reductase [Arthrobacter sp. zg-Y916]|uniref:aldo/keto reductase n=1 Tax=Arthrobacter sp. zg-Y916 TaxID=2894190 RepID=UPI001E50E20C|nr:aldo/keto reductase [Arthrobacter sp. zg-Y916]MCC9192141.1 aldo/keto reductase [Arthrobacter sp. zg-Y916]